LKPNRSKHFICKNFLLRTITLEKGKPGFYAPDIAKNLDTYESTIIQNLDDNEKSVKEFNISDITKNITFLTEAGLAKVLDLYSKRPRTKPFHKWIAYEVIPQIRKTGFYEESFSESEPPTKATQFFQLTIAIGHKNELSQYKICKAYTITFKQTGYDFSDVILKSPKAAHFDPEFFKNLTEGKLGIKMGLFQAWYDKFKDTPVCINDLAELADANSLNRKRHLTVTLRFLEGQIVGRFKIMPRPKQGNYFFWSISLAE